MRNTLALFVTLAVCACAPAARRNDMRATGGDEDAASTADAAATPGSLSADAPTAVPPDAADDPVPAAVDEAESDSPALDDQVSDDVPSGAVDVPRIDDAGKLDAVGHAADACPGYKKGTHTQSGVAVADFCAAYAKSCSYKSGGTLFADLADCQMTYLAGSDTVRTCRAGHLCEAVVSTTTTGKSTNCQAAAHGTVCH